jgi:putative phosphoribosyl transferase
MSALFADREDAGRQLAHMIAGEGDAVVVGLARGGVAVGDAVARHLGLPLTVLIVRKLGSPRNPELAIGAVSETGETWVDATTCAATGADAAHVEQQAREQAAEAERRRALYRRALPLSIVRNRVAVVVDDGIATGATARAGLRSVRALGARRVVLATPVASPLALQLLTPEADRIVALFVPDDFHAVGLYYDDFRQLTDDEVIAYLRRDRGT